MVGFGLLALDVLMQEFVVLLILSIGISLVMPAIAKNERPNVLFIA